MLVEKNEPNHDPEQHWFESDEGRCSKWCQEVMYNVYTIIHYIYMYNMCVRGTCTCTYYIYVPSYTHTRICMLHVTNY